MATENEQVVEALRSALIELEDARRVNEQLASRSQEPIAIVGMSCRYPGGASSPETLWDLIEGGQDAICEFPEDRGWDVANLYDPDPDHDGTSYTRRGGFVPEVAGFDAGFFGIGPREALAMDPQQRLLLEGAWEALEHAGIDPSSIAGSRTGVFAGISALEHGLDRHSLPTGVEDYLSVSALGSIISGRVAYAFGLEGPAISVDTACSSSLVAIHLASQALRAGECTLALAGGVTVLSTPGPFLAFSRQRGLSVDGRCRSFGAGADGVGFAEGMGLVVLERLGDARRNGHRVLALVRGSAVNQDGASNGLTAPNGPSQQRVIAQALANAGLKPEEVDVVEGHGTGTTLGDPIEAQSLLATYGQDRESPLWLGSVKSNIGHTQAAAGVAGVIKMVQALRHEQLPKSLHSQEPSPHVDWSQGNVKLLTSPVAWPKRQEPRRAGVSSFGISGTNAHLILEEPTPQPDPTARTARETGPLPLLLSAKSAEALHEQTERLLEYLGAHPEISPLDVAFTLAMRAKHEHRAVVVGTGRDGLLGGLSELAREQGSAGAIQGVAHEQGKVAFVFSGQGAQRPGMGSELYETFPVFAQELDGVCAAFDPHLERPLLEVMFATAGSEEAALLDGTDFAQPALFALEVALFRLLASFGVTPDYLIGHSVGELAAAHVAGVLSLEDACTLVAARGRLMGALPGGGAMAAIEATEAEVREGLDPRLSIAAVNGPSAVVVSGDEQAIAELESHWSARGRRTTRLRVSHAFHSTLMEPMLEELGALAEGLTFNEPSLPVVANVSGRLAAAELAGADYWVAHVRETVRFADGVDVLAREGVTRFIELGPDATLTGMLGECLGEVGEEQALLSTALRARHSEVQTLMCCLAEAFAHGLDVDWRVLFSGCGARLVELPTYAFQRRRYWLTSGAGDLATLGQHPTAHPFLGAAVQLAGEEEGWLLTGRLSPDSHPWLKDHMVKDTILLPGTGVIELALAAAATVGSHTLEELTLRAPLLLEARGSVQIQLKLSSADAAGRRELTIHSRAERSHEDEVEEAGWTHHASGVIGAAGLDVAGDELAPELRRFAEAPWPPPGAVELESDELYEQLAELGYRYGPSFQGLRRAWTADGDLYAEVELDGDLAAEAPRFRAHPALFDAAFHVALQDGLRHQGERARVYLPFTYTGVRLHQGGGANGWRVRLTSDGEGELTLQALDCDGAPVVSIDAVEGRPVKLEKLVRSTQAEDMLFELQWVPAGTAADSELAAVALGDVALPGVELERFVDLPGLADAIDAGTQAPQVVFVGCERQGDPELVASATANTHRALAQVQAFLADERFAGARLVFVTERALSTARADAPELSQSPLVGLVRSACSEYPERFGLIDHDGTDVSLGELLGALTGGDAQLAWRQGRLLVPRLSRQRAAESTPLQIDPQATVLITGGTGGLGALFARHLVGAHGVRHLLLASRRGAQAGGAQELREELERLGCEVRIAKCDVTSREDVAALLAAIPEGNPLGGVIHAAGTAENGLIASLDATRLDRVLAPKLDGALHLHELTEGLELSLFVLFSSVAGIWGGPGQANYAAANAFLDALAVYRRAHGLAAQAIAWGPWDLSMGLSGELPEAEAARLLAQISTHMAMAPLTAEQGLRLFDAAAGGESALVVAAHVERAALRAQARSGLLPALARSLVKVPTRPSPVGTGAFARRLASVAEHERDGLALVLVCDQVAAVLGDLAAEGVDPDRPFKDLGFDSLGATELRRRLTHASGLRLPSSVAFDYPNSRSLARHLRALAEGTSRQTQTIVRRSVERDEPIAVVGASCRYPGGVRSPSDLWRLLDEGADAISALPDDRGWDLEALYDPDPERHGTIYAREGGFIDDATDFDAAFFEISPREATAMDPHQRLLLEGAWEAIEGAGVDPHTLRGAQVGVFAGVMTYDYGTGSQHALREGFDTANIGGGVASGRISYTFGFEGPAMTVDTACSSSLVAIHLACQSLRAGECESALAGGATVLSSPGMLLYFSRQRGLALDGRCKAFGADADGTGFSDGMGVLFLERLSDARRNGRHVLGLIRGSAVNQDGASNGLTAPNGPSQERVIRTALASAGLATADVDAVEAHGTGTVLGDPIEAQALLATYGQDRPDGRPLWLGSVKSNLGHTQAAAGIAGVIKMLMAMRHGTLPRSLHLDVPSKHVDWSAGSVSLLSEPVAWEHGGRPRRAGVSSFGASGTNAHLILEAEEDAAGSASDPGPHPSRLDLPFVLSAKSDGALRAQAGRLHSHLQERPELAPLDVAHTLAGRSRFEHRAVVLAPTRDELLVRLEAISRGAGSEGVVRGVARRERKLAFLFSGQGSQRAGMGSELYDAFPAFAERFDAICAELDPLLDLSLKQSVFQPADPAADSPLDRTQLTQPALFALEVSLYELMRSFGIVPDYLIGHSIGEIAAAHVAGVFSLHDAAQLVAARGRLMGALSPQGGMLAVEASEQEALASLDGHEHHVSIAAVNGPAKVVLSGALEALEELELLWRGRARKTSRLRVSQAFHSTLMTPMLQELAEVARGLDFHAPSLPIISNVSGAIAAEELREPEYWVAHVREPVRFADGVTTLREAGVSAFLELGPDATLSTMACECLGEEAAERSLFAPSMRPRRPEAATFLELLAGSFAQGVKVDLSPLLAGRGARPVELPTYAFQRERHWLDAADTPAAGAPSRAAIEAPEPAPAGSHDSTPSSFEGALGQTLSETSESERDALVLELVRSHVAVVLGHSSPDAIDAERTFKELGLESQGALELRDRLSSATGLKLAATLVYEHPSPLELARELRLKAEGHARPRAQATRSAHTDEPIAIVGMSCRLPGGVSNPDELWELLARGGDAITEFPDDRGWELERVYDPDGARPDTTYTRRGGFLDDVDGFDADFFGIAPDEALAMDPQQRLLLEGSWEALEHAGIDPASLRGSDTGVFAGVAFSGYGLGAELLPESAPYRLTGSATSLISGRAAYAFGLEGPAVSIDTACSSSLVAIHMACQALRAGECSMALAGGVTVLATPVVYVEFARSRGLSPDGRCKSFSADADGAGFSEGIGMLVLKPLAQATRDGDRVLAVIRGSAVNQDGASNGLTAHSGPSQERVIQQALANSGLDPADIDAVEAHSTGTPLGDPIEARALLAAYGQGPRDRPLRLATIKSNIGHTQAAAGVAGVIKIVQALRHETLPMTLHAERPSAHVDWAEGEVELLSAPASWPRGERPRRAGVSSFGISGTNAHLILEEPAPSPELDRRVCPAVDSLAFVLSGNDRPALRAQAERLREHMAAHPELDLRDVAATLAVRRASLPRRAAALARDRAELMTALDALASGRGAHDLFEGRARREGKITFIFSGRGPRTAVDRELYRAFPAFAAALDDLCTAFEPHLKRPLKSMLFAPDGSTEALLLADARYGQVGLFALELALYRLIASFGVVPDYLLGHAVGELVAAHVAGVLSLEDACTLVAARGRLMSSLGDTPESVEIPAELEAIAADLTFSRPRIPVISNMSGEPLTDQEASTAAYWICTASQSMCFGDGASFLQKAGVTRLLELGPDNAALEAMAAQFTGSARGELLGCALRCPPGTSELLGFLTRAYVHGVAIDWRGLFPTEGHRQADLPTYAFQRERYWLAASSEAMGTESPSSRADALPVGVGEG